MRILHSSLLVVCWFIVSLLTPADGFGQLDQVAARYKLLQISANEEISQISFIQEKDSLVDDYSALAQIILVRHGEPALYKKGWKNRVEGMKFAINYDSAVILEPTIIPVKLQSNDISYLYTSKLPRSISTATYLNLDQLPIRSMSVFNEFERTILSFYDIKLPLGFWLNSSRILWFAGLNKKGIESFSSARRRAKRAADILQEDALREGKTLLVSHGLLNHFLVKYLKKQGWTEIYDGGKSYLSQKMLVKRR